MSLFRERLVLNVGCGPRREDALHAAFRSRDWRELRFDIDPTVDPDIVGSIVDMRDAVLTGGFDALWSSHNVEHLYAHEAPKAFAEFRRVLRPDGFALITCPDLRSIAQLIVGGRFGETIYHSPAGPIGVADMLFGHGRSIAEGRPHMAHRTGYTAETLGELLVEGGFEESWVTPGEGHELWAVGLCEEADRREVLRLLARGGLVLPQTAAEEA
jgi:SAM-dependent methyltransferase